MKTWIKLYTEINRDPDIGTLTWAQRGIWTALLALAGEIDDRDEGEQETGRLDTIDRVAWSIRCELAELQKTVSALTERGMVAMDEDILYLPNYSKRQSRPPSARPSAIAERVKRHRAKAEDKCNGVTPSMKRGVTPPDTDTDTDIDTEPESEAQPEPEHGRGGDGDAYEVLKAFGMNQPGKVIKETRLTPRQIIETTQYAEQEQLSPGLLRTMLRQNEAHQPRAPDNGSFAVCPVCYQHPCDCERD